MNSRAAVIAVTALSAWSKALSSYRTKVISA
jgi:hypothetical protein